MIRYIEHEPILIAISTSGDLLTALAALHDSGAVNDHVDDRLWHVPEITAYGKSRAPK